jgi:hypothetical protein
MNGWACGFFVIHGMMSVTDGPGIETVTNRETERVREKSLKLVLNNLPYVIFDRPYLILT